LGEGAPIAKPLDREVEGFNIFGGIEGLVDRSRGGEGGGGGAVVRQHLRLGEGNQCGGAIAFG